MNLIPMVVEQSNKGERSYDKYSLSLIHISEPTRH